MPSFSAGRAFEEASERREQVAEGGILVPVSAAVIAVFAALATLFANHSSISGLAEKNEAILFQTKSSDQYAYYESSRIKVHVYQALLGSGLVTGAGATKQMQGVVKTEQTKANRINKVAHRFELTATDHLDASERFMRAYESYEVAATLFEVSIVLVSITALTRTKVLLFIAYAASAVGVGFFSSGFLR